ncbi:protein of unknown function [Microbacterium pygmaeum]|uniref:Serine/arginine repetitive matrix protein 2 n=1 Tax=Microbacterium pygmaeum TaxID=370764 RepID=A0A1G7XJT0_9MICO|nr:protein of unknown function [Microbacterium pygmaeum]
MDAHNSAHRHSGKVNVVSDQTTRPDAEARLNEVHDRLVRSVEALIETDDWKRSIEFAAHFRSRSFNNTLLIWSQHAAAFEAGRVSETSPTYVAGFKQWHAVDRSVLSGQHGYMIFAPRTARFATTSPLDVSSWRRLAPRERPRSGEVVRTGVVGARPAYVWDISQTIGRPIVEVPRPHLLRGVAPAGLWTGLASLVDQEGFTLSLVASATSIGGANGRTDYSTKTVAVRADMDDAARTKTLAHELAHIRLHGPGHEALAHRGIGEVEAESVALMIAAAHGMDTQEYTIPYVATWASSVADADALVVVQRTGERVRRAAAAVLEMLPSEQMPAGDPPGLDRSAYGQAPPRHATTHTTPGRTADRTTARSIS